MKDLNSKLLSKCMNEQDDGVLIDIEVKPGAKTAGLEGVDEWRGCMVVRVKARAEKGKANKDVIKMLSSVLSLPSSSFIIVKGEKSCRKSIKILGACKEELSTMLEQGIDGK